MAIFNNINDLAYDTILENLGAAEQCIYKLRKADGGCYGMSALILLMSVIDSMGTFYENGVFTLLPENNADLKKRVKQPGAVTDHFEAMYDHYYKDYISEKEDFMDVLYRKYRCNPIHNNVLQYDYFLSIADDSKKSVIGKDGTKTTVYVDKLYEVTKEVFSKFCSDHNITLD